VPLEPISITLGSLGNEAGADLVKALITPRSPIDPWAVRRMLEITSSHPYYVHVACRVLLECCTYKSPITPSQVEDALQAMLEVPIAEFIVEWQSSLPREQIVLAVFGALRGHGGVATQYDIQKSCARYGLYPPLKTIVATIDNLVQRNILEKLGSNSYRFRLELFRLWIDHHYSPEELCRKQAWQFRQSMLANWSSVLFRSFARRRTLWLSLAAVVFVVLLVVAQPAMWRRRNVSTPTPRQVVSAAQASSTQAETLTVQATPTPSVPEIALPGYDLLVMARTESQSPWQIYALNSRTGDRTRLMATTSNDRTPKWSPDGNLIAFASDRDGDRDIYIVTLKDVLALGADYQPILLTQNKEPDWQPAWAPDGKRIAFSSYQEENWEIYVVDADGTNLVRLTDHAENDFSPTWAPDGERILFVSRRYGDADLFVLDLAGEDLLQLTSSELDEYDPVWSPDGQWIAYVTQIGSQSDLFVMHADGSDPVNLTNSRYADDFQPVWTPDSTQLIFVSYTSARGDYDLFVIQRDGSGMTVLDDDDSDTLAPSLRLLE
jgi:TolB protein